jgi:hypothetical protein
MERIAAARAARAEAASAASAPPDAEKSSRAGVVDYKGLKQAGYAATELAHETSGQRLELMMRQPVGDEQRVFGKLTAIECRPGPEIRFVVADGARTIVATAAQFSVVEVTGFRPGDLTITCGRRSPADQVALTWRPGEQDGGRTAGTAIAIEFLPDGYGPVK